MYFAILHENPCDGLCEILKKYFDEKSFECISIKNCCFPIESIIIAFAKAMKAFEHEENIAKRQDIETLIRLVGNRQIKTVIKLLNENLCKNQAHYVTLVHVNVKTLESTVIMKMREDVLRKIEALGCIAAHPIVAENAKNETLTEKCCSITSYLFNYWSNNNICNELMLLGVSGTSDVFIL
ncbi:MAG: hypothetical protein QXT53_04090 [Ignisphaera sp.]